VDVRSKRDRNDCKHAARFGLEFAFDFRAVLAHNFFFGRAYFRTNDHFFAAGRTLDKEQVLVAWFHFYLCNNKKVFFAQHTHTQKMSSSFTVDHLLAQDVNSSGDLLLNNASAGTVVVGSRLQVGFNGSAYTLPSSRGNNDQVLTASGDQVVWADAQGGGGGGGGGALIQNADGTAIVTCAVASTITGTVDSVDRLVCDTEKFMIASPNTGTRIELVDPPPPPPDEMSVAAPGPPSAGINMYIQDFPVFRADEDRTTLFGGKSASLSVPDSLNSIRVALTGVSVNDYYLPPTNGIDGYVMTARTNSRAEWLPPVSKYSFAVTFGGLMVQNGYFVLNGISSTPTITSISTSATFVTPFTCTLNYLSYNTNFTGAIPSPTKVIIETNLLGVTQEVGITANFGFSQTPILLNVPAATKIFLRFSCLDNSMDNSEANFTCVFQQL